MIKFMLACVVLILAGLALGGWKEFQARLGALFIGVGVVGLIGYVALNFYIVPKIHETVAQVTNPVSSVVDTGKSAVGGAIDKGREALQSVTGGKP